MLLQWVEDNYPGSPATGVAEQLCVAMRESSELECNVDLALVTFRRAAELPEGSALLLFALGRVVGWMAHAIEHYQTGALIRPRAAYTGPQPQGS